MNRKERQRHEFALLITTGIYHTLDQWTRVLLPFAQWSLQPSPTLDDLAYLTAISTLFTFIGTLFIAQLIEVFGLRISALISTCITALYQFVICQTHSYYVYLIIQSLLMFNNMQMIIDAAVLNLEGEDGDDKKRSRLITKILIPQSVGYALGPYLALQVIFFMTPTLDGSQLFCSFLSVATLLPVVWKFFPDYQNSSKSLTPDLSGYVQLMKNERTRWCVLLLMLVSGPYAAYDNIVRISLASTAIRDPGSLHNLFMIIGVTTMVVNTLLLPKLQEMLSPQVLLTVAFSLLSVSYVYLAIFRAYAFLLIGMPIQVIGVTIALGEISSQLMGTIGKGGAGKAAALIRMAQLSAGFLVPFLTGTTFHSQDSTLLCAFSAFVSVSAIPIVRQYGSFMKFNSACLPGLFVGKTE